VSPERILDGANGPGWCEDLIAFQTWCRQRTYEGKRWVPFAKGGAYSPYYADLHLVVNWERDEEELKAWADPLYGNSGWSRIIKSVDFYFRPGLTWSDRTTRLFSARIWPAGGIFSVKGSAGFFSGAELFVLGLMNSLLFNGFLSLLVGAGDAAARSYQVGTIGSVPFPVEVSIGDYNILKNIIFEAVDIKRTLDNTNEGGYVFYLPALLRMQGDVLAARINSYQACVAKTEEKLAECQSIVDNIAFHIYGIAGDDRQAIL
jgi:hypothetical protein